MFCHTFWSRRKKKFITEERARQRRREWIMAIMRSNKLEGKSHLGIYSIESIGPTKQSILLWMTMFLYIQLDLFAMNYVKIYFLWFHFVSLCRHFLYYSLLFDNKPILIMTAKASNWKCLLRTYFYCCCWMNKIVERLFNYFSQHENVCKRQRKQIESQTWTFEIQAENNIENVLCF